MGCLPHSLCPCWSQFWGLQGSLTAPEPGDGGHQRGLSLRMGGGRWRAGEKQPSPPPPLPRTNRKSAAGFHGDGAPTGGLDRLAGPGQREEQVSRRMPVQHSPR